MATEGTVEDPPTLELGDVEVRPALDGEAASAPSLEGEPTLNTGGKG